MIDLLRLPGVGHVLRWRHARAAMQVPLLLIAVLLLYDGFFGEQLAPKNLAGVIPWVQWRGLLVLGLLLGGNFFCMACPFMLPRALAKRLLPANRTWPRWLRSKWLAIGLLLAFFWAYEGLNLWASPLLTAWVLLAYFLCAFVLDGCFKGAAFCKYVCPIGQFNFVQSLVSPLEVAVRDPAICARCTTKDCIRGRYEEGLSPRRPAPITLEARPPARPVRGASSPPPQRLAQNGCELWLFQERKVGNLDCTFCLDCVHACPHTNVGILARIPTSELWDDPWRSGIGQFTRRPDLAVLVLVLVFSAFVNAFGMIGPVLPIEQAIGTALGTGNKAIVVLVLDGALLLVLPAVVMGLTVWTSRALAGTAASLVDVATRYSFSLVPLGFGMWLAHYGFHFMTGALTVVPVVQNFFFNLGIPLFGTPRLELGPIAPSAWLLPIETSFLELGLLGTLFVAYQVARTEQKTRSLAIGAMLPWGVLAVALFAIGVWIMAQPMQMRGTIFG